MSIAFAYTRMPHHGAHAGYDQVARVLIDQGHATRIDAHVPRLLPSRALTWMARRSGMEWYEPSSVGLEIATARRLCSGSGEVCHILYGEDSYRYLSLLGRRVRRGGSRLVCTYHQPPDVLRRVVPRSSILKGLDAVIAVASNQVDFLASVVGSERVYVVPHGVDTDFFCPAHRNQDSSLHCLFVGQWLRDFDTLQGVIELIGRVDPKMHFTVVTSDERAAQFRPLVNTTVRTRVSDAELLLAYQAADLVVLPMLDATANNSILEAMACGLPLVVTEVGGVRDYASSECARFVRPGDVKHLADVILSLRDDAPARAEMGRQSRHRSIRFAWKRVAQELRDTLNRVADTQGTTGA